MKKTISILLALLLIFALAACGGNPATTTTPPATGTAPATPTGTPPATPTGTAPTESTPPASIAPGTGITIAVGSKDFTEQLILGQITMQALAAHGFTVADKTNVAGSNTCRDALTSGAFDIYWEYTGTAWLSLLGHDTVPTGGAQALYDAVKAEDAGNNVVWLDPAPLNDTYALVMQKDKADALNIKTYKDLANYIDQNPNKLVLCCDQEFTARPDGLPGLVSTYDMNFGNSLNIMDMGLAYQALQNKQADVAMVFATDGRIAQYGLVVLQDDKDFFPAYNAAACIRSDVLAKAPQIADILNPIAPLLTTEVMQQLNIQVDGPDARDPKDVAHDWLVQNGFINS